jgi:ketosteroid isomerase-like protein
MPTHAEATTLFDRRRTAWLREDLAAYLDCFTEDLVFGSPVHDPPLAGRAAFAELVQRSNAAMRPVSFDVHALAAAGDLVLAEWTIVMAVRTAGQRIAWRGMSSAVYREGRIAVWREYWNPADLAKPRA